jgi:hypothetical protein
LKAGCCAGILEHATMLPLDNVKVFSFYPKFKRLTFKLCQIKALNRHLEKLGKLDVHNNIIKKKWIAFFLLGTDPYSFGMYACPCMLFYKL